MRGQFFNPCTAQYDTALVAEGQSYFKRFAVLSECCLAGARKTRKRLDKCINCLWLWYKF